MRFRIYNRTMLSYALILLLASFFATLALAGVALIPRERIQVKLEESAIYLAQQHTEHFPYQLIDGMNSSNLDEVADANLLNVASFFDGRMPLESALTARWYFTGYGSENEDFYKVVMEDAEPNAQYLRYWHGSLLFVRPMLLIWNIKQIYAFNAVAMAALFVWLLSLLFRKGMKLETAALVISMIVVSAWFVPWCLEYTWMFLLMEVISIIAVKLAMRGKNLDLLFFITGIITIFLDFFTTELLAILMPVLLVMRIRIRRGKSGNWTFLIKSCLLWGIGYCAMWAMKWGIASLVLGRATLPDVMNQAGIHLGVEAGMTNMQSVLDTLRRNIGCLLPFDFGLFPSIGVIMLLLVLLAVGLRKRKLVIQKPSGNMWIYLVIGLIPYIRFIIIRHHSWYHYFFTYRAQAATVMALCYVIAEVVQINRRVTHTPPMPLT